jgi:hypothetical protein
MRPTIKELHNESRFNKLADFHIDDTFKFILNPDGYGKEPPQKPSAKDQALYGIFFFLLLAGLGFVCGAYLFAGKISSWEFLLALATFILIVIPIHEGIHALVFKSFGARNVGFGLVPKAGMVYAYAQDFPISMKELVRVAVMPFLVISLLLILGLQTFPQYQFYFVFIFLIHTFVCFGDFALIKYAINNRHRKIYTYDDVKHAKRTYFFEKRQD